MDSEQTIFMTQPKGLARILSLGDQEKELWKADEIEAMWRHQLSAPIGVDLETVVSVTATELRKAPQFDSYRDKSFAALLGDAKPPIELLKLTKEFAKQTLRDCEEAILKEVASALYYASYAAAVLHHSQYIGSMTDAELKPGFSWALRQSWLDEQTREVISNAASKLQA